MPTPLAAPLFLSPSFPTFFIRNLPPSLSFPPVVNGNPSIPSSPTSFIGDPSNLRFARIRPAGEVLFFREKDPKPFLPGYIPSGLLAFGPNHMAAQLASLKQCSPKGKDSVGASAAPKAKGSKASLIQNPYSIPHLQILSVHNSYRWVAW